MRIDSALCITLCALLGPLSAQSTGAAHLPPFDALYAFGDSLSDSGNLYRITRTPGPLGDALPDVPNPYYFQGRFSNGYNFVDRISQRLYGYSTPSTPMLAGGTNYAVAGAFTGQGNIALPGLPGVPPTGMLAQYGAWTAQHASADPRALYVVYGGANDLFGLVRALPLVDPAQRDAFVRHGIGEAAGNLAQIIGGLIDRGAQHILVPNVPDLGLTPSLAGTGLESAGSAVTLAFNQALADRLQALNGARDIVPLDVYGLFRSVIAKPQLYGLTEVTRACFPDGLTPDPAGTPCPDPQHYLFWDEMHPTARAHGLLAAAALAALQVPEPGIAGLFVLVGLLLGAARTRLRVRTV
jgi:phospholipase/lecithinase/hemolysin